MLEYNSIAALAGEAQRQHCTISQVVLPEQALALGMSEKQLLDDLAERLDVMLLSAQKGFAPGLCSTSGLTGGDGLRMRGYAATGQALSGDFCSRAVATALAVSEYNAAMGKIVAAPTAGSCGILPAGILTMMELRETDRHRAVMGLVTAGALGLVIANTATIAGAEGGCQAECGSAAAMTAGALVELSGGSPAMVEHACAIALKNQMGLVCDPVAGLVEVPCIKRNAGGIMCAVTAADMALAGIRSIIPVDEVVDAMREVGDALPATLRETAKGGLAATPTGMAIQNRIFGTPSSQP